MMSKFISLRRNYPKFIYESYAWEWVDVEGSVTAADNNIGADAGGGRRAVKMSFVFKTLDANGGEAFVFEPNVLLSMPSVLCCCGSESQSDPQIDILVFNCGMIEMISYWKATCSPITQVVCGVLTDEQQTWWKHLYFNGLGELFYVNGIDTDQEWFMRLQNPVNESEIRPNAMPNKMTPPNGGNRALVPVGGGKDSCVTMETLKMTGGLSDDKTVVGNEFVPFIINPRGATEKCCVQAGFSSAQVVVMYRSTDPLLLEMNRRGFLNGHTPFSAMLAFYSTLAATLAGASYIVLSNESSANEATVAAISDNNGVYNGGVNHQYSKSFEFESDFREYAKRFLFGDIAKEYSHPEYFSLLRPLSEAHIAKIFSQHPQYFDVFKSCNVGSKTDSWCGHCAKCLFVYIILAPFLSPETLQKIFNGKNLLDDMSLQKEFDELVGAADVKPFECVGTVSEINWALQQISARSAKQHKGALLDHYKTLAVSKIPQQTEKIFTLNPNHALPSLFEEALQKVISL